MINFKPIELKDKTIFDKYYDINKDIASEYNFTTLYAWQEMYGNYYAIINDCLCVKSTEGYMFPIGKKENIQTALEELVKDSKADGKIFKIMSVSKRMEAEFENINKKGQEYKVKEQRQLFDYVYETEKFTTLAGKKMRKKRNHFNYFNMNYDYQLVDLDEKMAKDSADKINELIMDRSLNPEEELFATLKVLKDREELGLISKVLIADGEIIGVIMAQEHNGTALIHIAKSDIEYRGASVALFHLFLKDFLIECKYTNFMEDMGIDGLRKMKLSYYPDIMVEKSYIEKVYSKNCSFVGTSFKTVMSVEKKHYEHIIN